MIDFGRELINLNDTNLIDKNTIGPKAYRLAELKNIGLNVPNAFFISSVVFDEFILQSEELQELITKLIKSEDLEDRLKIADEVKKNIMKVEFPEKMRIKIMQKFEENKFSKVSVRSAALCEDTKNLSFAGQFKTFLNVEKEQIIESIKKCWASLFSKQVMLYAYYNNIDFHELKMSVIIQEMIQAEKAGVMFTKNIKNGNVNELLIEFSNGLCENIVSGIVNPSIIIIEKKSGKILQKKLINKNSISDKEIKLIYEAGLKIEKNYGSPQDIEWSILRNKLFILQTRPITT